MSTDRPSGKTWTLLELLNWTRDFFTQKGLDNPRLNAELLLAHVLGVERIMLYVRFDQSLSDAQTERYRDFVRRRAAREPLQYILGHAEFRGLQFAVGPGVLVPRPETEMLVEKTLALLADRPEAAVLDVGAGSGCIGITLARARPGWRVTAVDASEDAVRFARINAGLHTVDARYTVCRGSLFDPLPSLGLSGPCFDAIVSNPPYVRSCELAGLQPEVRDYEPVEALDGGADGLSVYRRLIPESADWLRADGALILEIAPELREGIGKIAASSGKFLEPEFADDVFGQLRMAVLRPRTRAKNAAS